jgi:fatty acid desaturase
VKVLVVFVVFAAAVVAAAVVGVVTVGVVVVVVVVAVVTITHHVAQLFVPIPLLTPWSYMVHPPAGRSRNFGIGLPTNAPVRPMPVWS